MNDGDWVESCTALIEHYDGRFEIIEWAKLRDSLIEGAHAHSDSNGRLVPAS